MYLYVAIGIVIAAMALSGLLIWVVSKKSPEGSLADRIPTNVYAVTAGAMSLLAGFTIAAAFGVYSNAQQAVRSEASALLQMYRATGFMEDPLRGTLRDDLLCYADRVTTLEWPALASGDTSHVVQVRQAMVAMDDALVTPAGQKQAGAGASLWESGNSALYAARAQRYGSADWQVPPIVYVLLIAGSLITILSLFTFADRSKPGWGHAMVIIGPVFVAVASLEVILFFDSPFLDTPGSVDASPISAAVEYIEADMTSRGITIVPTCSTVQPIGAAASGEVPSATS